MVRISSDQELFLVQSRDRKGYQGNFHLLKILILPGQILVANAGSTIRVAGWYTESADTIYVAHMQAAGAMLVYRRSTVSSSQCMHSLATALRSLLFLIYMSIRCHPKFLMVAYFSLLTILTCLICSAESPSAKAAMLQDDLNALSQWIVMSKMRLNLNQY